MKLKVFILRMIWVMFGYLLPSSSFLHRVGWFASVRGGTAADLKGNPLPWMTYAAISFLESRITARMDVFEYSCGNSTLWWAARVNSITSCEHDAYWFGRIAKLPVCNIHLHHIKLEYGGAYSKKIMEYNNQFDIVVIDGRDRVNCAKNCLPALKDNGVVIWDNSDRENYDEGYKFLLQNGFRRLDFAGIGPVNADGWCTSIFYRSNNCFEL